MMFKVLVIQTTNNLSDERAEFLINDRLSFMRFLGLGLSDRIPDARTIWLFREKLTKAGAIGPLFERFDATLRQSGYIAMSGQIVDASLIAAPRQRNTNEEKAAIKEGRVPDDWKNKPAKLRQKDRDARLIPRSAVRSNGRRHRSISNAGSAVVETKRPAARRGKIKQDKTIKDRKLALIENRKEAFLRMGDEISGSRKA
jgi:IS5 family transposase